MSISPILVGTVANDGTGDPLRTAFQKINTNYTELDGPVFNVRAYGAIGDGVTDDTAAFRLAIAAAAAQIEYFGTTSISMPPVVIPTVASASGQTKSYLITDTLTLPQGLRMRGLGGQGPVLQFKPANNLSTLFTFFGTSESMPANILLENLFCYQAGTANTSIGFRMRNCDFVQLRGCVFSNFRVGLWMDWGQDLETFDSQFTQCIRGIQLGGNLSQTETPAPPAGIRGGPATPFLDNACIVFCKFAQNQVDVSHIGTQQSHGNTLILNSTFFEGAAVTGKTRYIHVTRLKNLNVQNCWFECPNASRYGIVMDTNDYDGNAGAPNYGCLVTNNHFLFTNGTGCYGVNVTRGHADILDNVFEISTSGSTGGILLADATTPSYVGPNSWISYPDIEIGVPNTGIVITGQPAGGHNVWRPGNSLTAPTYSASITPNATAGEWHTITATNGTAFTINGPSNARAGVIVIEIVNSSGGALGVLTWAGGGGGFALTGGAWVQPANTLRRNITFQWSSTASRWVEVVRTGADY